MQRINFAVIAKAPVDRLTKFAYERGWRHLRLLSSVGNSFKRDYHAETAEGHQMPMLTVVHRGNDGIRRGVRHQVRNKRRYIRRHAPGLSH